jgi:hypothetical protein
MEERRSVAVVSTIVVSVVSIVVSVVVFFVLGLLLVKLLWAWTIPDLFPVAVQRGFIAGQVS